MDDAKERTSNARDAGAPARPAISTAKILLVDDQPARLLAYEAVLSNLDVRCVRAASGAEALEQMITQDFAVILLDVNMPGMDGYEVARLIREHHRFQRTPIIFVTGVYVTERDRMKGYEVGAIDYMSIPVEPAALRAKVATLVELHQRRQELERMNDALRAARAENEAQHARTLAEREAQLRIIFEHPTEFAIVLEATRDASGAIVDWVYRNANLNALNLLGQSRETLLGRKLSEVAPERAEEVAAHCLKVLGTREMVRYEARYKDRDFLVTLFPMGLDAVVGSSVDITERKQARVQLRASERRYKALIDNAPVAVAYNDLSGRFEYANRAFCDLVGYTADELLGKTWQHITHPEDVGDDLSLANLVRAGRIPHYTLEKRYLRKDGAVVWVNLFGNFVLDDEGKPIQGVAAAIDITDRKLAEAALRQSEERFKELANNIDQFVWTCDELGQATWYSDRWYEYTGTTFAEMQGDGWKKVHDPAHLDRVVASLQECLRSGTAWEDTFPLRGKEGQYRWFLSRAVPIRDASGSVVRWFGTNTDVTDLRGLQETLKDKDRRKDGFLAVLAHELRNPIAPIRNGAQLLARLTVEGDAIRPVSAMIERQSVHLSRLLDDLLDAARISCDRIELRREITGISECVDAAVEMVAPVVREKGHLLEVVPSPRPMFVDGDKVRLIHCLVNLLNNAARFTAPGGAIKLRFFAEGASAVVEIVDTGAGISAELLPRIFDGFVQVPQALSQSSDGLGVGLSICKRLVELHGGSISARSAGIGRGATFALRLPLVRQTRGSSAPTLIAAASWRLLIVDDNSDAAQTLAALLRLEGQSVSTAYSGTEGLERAQAERPDLVLLDLGMPDVDGYEVARRMRAADPKVRLVALSGFGPPADRQRFLRAGFEQYLVKPVDAALIVRLLSADRS
jgi:PAS domain S-box-containing protein